MESAFLLSITIIATITITIIIIIIITTAVIIVLIYNDQLCNGCVTACNMKPAF